MKSIICKNLTKVYEVNSKKINAINAINFEIDNGEIVGLLGPNGAGKTTLIKSICNLITPTFGEIYVKGVKNSVNSHHLYNYISAVLEGNRNILWRLTVKENLEFFAGLQGYSSSSVKREIEYFLNLFQLDEKRDIEARFLSRGMQQKLAITCALIKKTDIIILDEPTLGLDVEMEWKMREFFENKDFLNGRTILISSHNMNFIESVCDRVIIINKGSIIEDNKISKLKSFFRAKEYEIVVTTPSDLKIFDIIKEKFEVNIKSDTNITKLSLITSDSIQPLIDIMKFVSEIGLNIISIYSLEPNLEKIYTKLMKNKVYE